MTTNHTISINPQYQARDPFTWAEISRITALPVIRPIWVPGTDPRQNPELEEFSRMHVQAKAFDDGFRLLPGQVEAISAYQIYNGGVFGKLPVGSGKCITGDTEIWDLEKGRRRADEVGPVSVPSLEVSTGFIKDRPGTCFLSGHKPCAELLLASGHKVSLSLDHPVFTPKGWVKADDLCLDDLVAVPRLYPVCFTWFQTPDVVVRFAAQIMANGGTSNTATSLCDEPGPLLDEFVEDVKLLGGSCTVKQSRSKAMDVDCRGMKPLVDDLGMRCLSKHKRVPARFYNLDYRQTALFLNRFFAADGHVSEDKRCIECTQASEGMVRDIQFMLQKLAIDARVRYKVSSYVKEGIRHNFDSWRLSVTGKKDLIHFFRTVGHPLGQEEKCQRMEKVLVTIVGNPNFDVVPIGPREVSEIAEEMKIPKTPLQKHFGATHGQYVSHQSFSAWVKASGYSGKYAWLATGDLRWERVKSLSPVGIKEVYDLNVPGTESFVGNGIVLHNTLLGLMIAAHAFSKGLTKMLLLVPPEVLGQLVNTDIGWARSRVEINYPIHILGGRPMEYRRNLCKSMRKGLYIMPYSLLSTKDTSENLAAIAPQLVIADEAHRLANHSAARTRRVLSMLKHLFDGGHPAELVLMSGTITNKSIKDYYHLIKWCLSSRCPLPLSDAMANDWALLIDASAAGENYSPGPLGTAPILPLVKWAEQHFPNTPGGFPRDVYGFRRAYELRLSSTPCVVASGDIDIGTSLLMQNHKLVDSTKHPKWDELKKFMDGVEENWTTPNGDEIDFAIHKWKWLNELSCGFYNELTWPTPEVFAKRKGINTAKAEEIIQHAKIHHQAQQEYARILRPWLERCSKAGCDTPFLVGQSMMRNGAKEVGKELYNAWKDWKDLDFEGRPDRDSRGVRVCDYKIQAMVEWVKSTADERGPLGAIIWVHHQEVGHWAVEALREAGCKDVLHAPAGDQANAAILDKARAGSVVVASISAHGTGKNLQHFQFMYVMQWPRHAPTAEQMIGRLHRRGQEADELVVHTNHTTMFDQLNFAACLNDALYIHQTTGSKQKLIYSNYDPMPVIFPPAVLVQKGLEAMALDAQQQKMMAEKFGGYHA